MKKLLKIALFSIGLITSCVAVTAAAETRAYAALTKEKTQPDRKKLLDVTRAKAESLFNRKVKLSVRYLGTENNWAIGLLVPVAADGQAFEWRKSFAHRQPTAASQSGWIEVLLKKEKGNWVVLDFVPEGEGAGLNVWQKAHPGLPQSLFDHAEVATNCDPCQ